MDGRWAERVEAAWATAEALMMMLLVEAVEEVEGVGGPDVTDGT